MFPKVMIVLWLLFAIALVAAASYGVSAYQNRNQLLDLRTEAMIKDDVVDPIAIGARFMKIIADNDARLNFAEALNAARTYPDRPVGARLDDFEERARNDETFAGLLEKPVEDVRMEVEIAREHAAKAIGAVNRWSWSQFKATIALALGILIFAVNSASHVGHLLWTRRSNS